MKIWSSSTDVETDASFQKADYPLPEILTGTDPRGGGFPASAPPFCHINNNKYAKSSIMLI